MHVAICIDHCASVRLLCHASYSRTIDIDFCRRRSDILTFVEGGLTYLVDLLNTVTFTGNRGSDIYDSLLFYTKYLYDQIKCF